MRFKANQFNKFDVLIISIIILIGLIHLPHPFSGDQALFTTSALKMSKGAVLYRDFWDLKQPGIFIFYLLAGSLFGFTELGIHLFELLYWLAFSIISITCLKSYFDNRTVASLAPLLTMGVYYGVSGSWHLTQVEIIVTFPIFLSLWYASMSSQEGNLFRQMFLSGLMGGVVLAFKFLFLPIVLSFWLTALIYATVWKRERFGDVAARMIAPVLLGMLLPLTILFCYFAASGTLSLLAYAFFEYPSRAMAELPRPGFDRLLNGLRWFIGWSAPLMALAFVGVSLSHGRSLLTINLALWFFVGLGVILIQGLSWWEYHYLLLLIPLGLLAAKGLDILWGHGKKYGMSFPRWRTRVAAAFSLALLFSPLLVTLALKSLSLARHGFALRREERLRYQSIVSKDYSAVSDYKTALEEIAFLSEPTSLPGKIYVCGNPVYYYLSQRDQAIAANGWMLELFLPEQWAEMNEQLEEARPSYLFISAEYPEIIQSRSPSTARLIEENYSVMRRSNAGIWYILK